MERKTITRLTIAGVVLLVAILFLSGAVGGEDMTYQQNAAVRAALDPATQDGTYTAESANNFSTVKVKAVIEGAQITDCEITSSGEATDLLTDDIRSQWAAAIVESQSADNGHLRRDAGLLRRLRAGSLRRHTGPGRRRRGRGRRGGSRARRGCGDRSRDRRSGGRARS